MLELTELQKKLFDITLDWNKNEETMGENAALEVACGQHGVTSQWYYDNFVDHAAVLSPALRVYYESKNKDKKKKRRK